MGESMTPQSTSLFYVADSPEAADEVAKVTGKIVAAIYKGDSGSLVQFRDFEQYLIVISTMIPQFGDPRPTEEPTGVTEIELKGMIPAVMVSVSGSGKYPDPEFWRVWDDPDAQSLIGQMVTGYSFVMVPMTDGSRTGAAMVELSGNRFIGTTLQGVSVLTRPNAPRVS